MAGLTTLALALASSTAVAQPPSITLGQIAPFKGAGAEFGEYYRDGAALGVQHINAAEHPGPGDDTLGIDTADLGEMGVVGGGAHRLAHAGPFEQDIDGGDQTEGEHENEQLVGADTHAEWQIEGRVGPPCRREMPVLAEAQREETDITFMFLNQGKDPAQISRFLNHESLTLDNLLLDAQLDFGDRVGARAIPTTLFYDADGRLLDTHFGELSRATLNRELERLR